MLNDKAMLVVTKPFRGIDVGEHVVATFTPRAKCWNWSDGKNNSYLVSSNEMKRHFSLKRRQVFKVCQCGREDYEFGVDTYICLPCIWAKNKNVSNG
jgi:hypothetical protein